MSDVTFKVRRQDPRNGAAPTYQEYNTQIDSSDSVFDVLTRIREEQDGSLAFRGNCYRGFCGDCVVRMNGKLTLSCLTNAEKTVKDDVITVDPAPYAKPVKDLLPDTETFLWNKYRSMDPWLKTNGKAAEPVTEEAMAGVRKAMRCTMCGLCDLGCTVIDIDLDFVGPAALTKAYRFLVDPRDSAKKERLQQAGEPKGMWDCVHCWEASEHCPAGIEPTHRIMEMRDMAVLHGVKSGTRNPQVARHYDSFAKSVKKTGWLDEFRITLETKGILGSLRLAPVALKAFTKGKVAIKHEKRAGAEQIGRIFDKVENEYRDK